MRHPSFVHCGIDLLPSPLAGGYDLNSSHGVHMSTLTGAIAELARAARSASEHLIHREAIAELIILAAVAREHLLLIGAPGTAKSAIAKRMAQVFDGRYFEYLMGRFTEPNEIFGPIDLRRLREGEVSTETRGMLPEAEFAFLDEIFLGSTAILNTLLGVLNERRFRRGHTDMHCPLKVCIGAANALPEDPSLAAFADRFLLHCFVDPVADHELEALLLAGRAAETDVMHSMAHAQSLEVLHSAARAVDISQTAPLMARAIRELRKVDVNLSDRRIVKAQNLIAAVAALAGRNQAQASDLWPLIYAIPTKAQQETGREVLSELLQVAVHPLLSYATEAAAQSPISRTPRLLLAAQTLDLSNRIATEQWLRELDANFPLEQLPMELVDWRASAVQAMAQT